MCIAFWVISKPEVATPPAFNLDDGKTARKTHEKDALQVEKGDKVTYTITVYNEGTVAGTNATVTIADFSGVPVAAYEGTVTYSVTYVPAP